MSDVKAAGEVRRWVSPYAAGTESYRGLVDTKDRTEPDHDEGPFFVLASDYDRTVGKMQDEFDAVVERLREAEGYAVKLASDYDALKAECAEMKAGYSLTIRRQAEHYDIALSEKRSTIASLTQSQAELAGKLEEASAVLLREQELHRDACQRAVELTSRLRKMEGALRVLSKASWDAVDVRIFALDALSTSQSREGGGT